MIIKSIGEQFYSELYIFVRVSYTTNEKLLQ